MAFPRAQKRALIAYGLSGRDCEGAECWKAAIGALSGL